MLILLAGKELTIGIIAGVLLLLIAAAAIFFVMRKKDQKKAMEFLEGLGNNILTIIFQTIAEFKPSEDPQYTLADFEAELIHNIYDKTWDYVKEEADKNIEVDLITKTIFKYIDKDVVVKFIDEILIKNNIQTAIIETYNSERGAAIEEKAVEEDKDLEKEYSDTAQYNESVDEDNDLAPAEEEVHTEEEVAAINPPKDEEDDVYDPEDDTQELLPEEDNEAPVIITKTDKNGNTLYYEVLPGGTKKRVSKTYADSIKNHQ